MFRNVGRPHSCDTGSNTVPDEGKNQEKQETFSVLTELITVEESRINRKETRKQERA